MPQTAPPDDRPPLVTAVAVIAIVAGTVPFAEIIATLTSSRFASFFLPLVREMLPLSTAATLAVHFAVGVVDLMLGVGILLRYRLAVFGMVARSFIGFVFDYLTFRAHIPTGALFGFLVNIGIVVVSLLPKSRTWFRPSHQ
jgi:hypothetical protein